MLGGEALGRFLWDVIRRELECEGTRWTGAWADAVSAEELFDK